MHRGTSDAFRLDIEENLIRLCQICHTEVHSGSRSHIGAWSRDTLFQVVADREGRSFEALKRFVIILRNFNPRTKDAENHTDGPSQIDLFRREVGLDDPEPEEEPEVSGVPNDDPQEHRGAGFPTFEDWKSF